MEYQLNIGVLRDNRLKWLIYDQGMDRRLLREVALKLIHTGYADYFNISILSTTKATKL